MDFNIQINRDSRVCVFKSRAGRVEVFCDPNKTYNPFAMQHTYHTAHPQCNTPKTHCKAGHVVCLVCVVSCVLTIDSLCHV